MLTPQPVVGARAAGGKMNAARGRDGDGGGEGNSEGARGASAGALLLPSGVPAAEAQRLDALVSRYVGQGATAGASETESRPSSAASSCEGGGASSSCGGGGGGVAGDGGGGRRRRQKKKKLADPSLASLDPPLGELRSAAQRGDALRLSLLVRRAATLAQLEDRDGAACASAHACGGGATALVWAAYHGHTEAVRVLWEQGYCRVVRSSAKALREALVCGNNMGENALWWAAARGHVRCFDFLWGTCMKNAFGSDTEALRAELARENVDFPGGYRAMAEAELADARAASPEGEQVERAVQEDQAIAERAASFARALEPRMGFTVVEIARERGHVPILDILDRMQLQADC